MKTSITVIALAITAIAGCASNPVAPAGMKVGQFVSFECAGGKRFQARLAEGGGSVRVRNEGGYELDRKAAGVYEADGWKLVTQGEGGTELFHNGKSAMKNCKAA